MISPLMDETTEAVVLRVLEWSQPFPANCFATVIELFHVIHCVGTLIGSDAVD